MLRPHVRGGAVALALFLAPLASPARADDAPSTSTAPLSLAELVDLALEHNLQVKIDDARIAQAEALSAFAASQAYPRITATTLFGGPTPEVRTTTRNDLSTLTPASLENDLVLGQLGVAVRVNAEASLPLYTFGKIDRGKRAAEHLVTAARHGRTATQAEVALNVQRAFWTYQLTRAFLGSLAEGKRTLDKVLAQIEALLEAESPQVTENDRLRLRFMVSSLLAREAEARAGQELSLRALRLLIGRGQETPLSVAEAELGELPPAPPAVEALVRGAREDRPELRALREVVRAAEEFAVLRQRMFLPDLFLGGLFQYAYTSNATNQTNPFLFDPYNDVTLALGVGVRVELDVLQKLAQLEQAEAEAQLRVAQDRLATEASDLEVRRLHLDVVAGYERVSRLEEANRTSRSWLTACALGYDLGTGDAEELMDAFLAWATAEADLARVRHETRLRLGELARAAGRVAAAAP